MGSPGDEASTPPTERPQHPPAPHRAPTPPPGPVFGSTVHHLQKPGPVEEAPSKARNLGRSAKLRAALETEEPFLFPTRARQS